MGLWKAEREFLEAAMEYCRQWGFDTDKPVFINIPEAPDSMERLKRSYQALLESEKGKPDA